MALNRGDIAFVQYNADGTDNFAFVTLVDIPAGEVILFTDNGWLNTNAFRAGEGTITWTAPAGGVAAGTVITISTTPGASLGTVTESGDLNFSADGDQIIAYQSMSGVITPIAALNNEGVAVFQADASNSNTSALPQGLVLGESAVALNEVDNAVYTGPTSGDKASLQAALNNPANWTGSDSVNQTFSGSFSLGGGGTVPTVSIAATDANAAEASTTVNPGTFTISRTGSTAAALTVNYTIGGTATNGIDYNRLAGSAVIPAGQSSVTINLTPVNDATSEGNETILLTLTDTAAYDLAGTGTATVALADNTSGNLKKVGGVTSANGAEIPAFDPINDRLFVVAGATVDFYTVSNTGALTLAGALIPGFAAPAGTEILPNSVAVKNGIVAVAYAIRETASGTQQTGKVAFFNAADNSFIRAVDVGALPDMLTFTPDGTKVLVANEGEPNEDYSVDPEGSISIIDISGGVANLTQSNVTTADFSAFNAQKAELIAQGVRIVKPDATVAQDFEPEYITVSGDGLTARITLQENNAIAVLDLQTGQITEIQPLGLKNHNLPGNGLDTGDRDGSGNTTLLNIRNQPVFGMYQPDAIASYTVNGQTYYITANEGDARVRPTGDGIISGVNEAGIFNEEVRVGSSSYVLDPTVFPNASTLKTNANLGRLTVTTASGDTDGDGDFDQIHAFGARSFSIWDSNGNQVFDSGDQLERITATQVPSLFNSDGNFTSPNFDTRSDNKGPEPEGVVVGVVNGRTYAFIGLERVGDVIVYDVTNPTRPEFIEYINTPEDIGPEGLTFIAAADSPTGKPLLVTANEISKTVAVFEFTPPPAIYDIQGAGHTSPFVGQRVSVKGIVTAVDSNGFYFQDAVGDGNSATSDGIFVFTSSRPTVTVGDEVRVTGSVSEFIPGGASTGNLSTTQIGGNLTITTLSTGNTLPTAVVLGVDRTPPTEVIDNDQATKYNVLQGGGVYDPINDGLDFYESLEGMRVTINDALAVSATNEFGEIFTVVNSGVGATGLSDRGTINIAPRDFNPERIQVQFDSGILPGFSQNVNVGAILGDVTGVVGYNFGNFEVNVTEAFTPVAASTLTPEVTQLVSTVNNLTIASYNVLNLDPKLEDVNKVSGNTLSQRQSNVDDDTARFAEIAQQIVNNLKGPDILGLQEVQDNTGAEINDGVISASDTLQNLIDAIVAAGGPSYQFIDNPFITEGASGGQPGGNIRTAFLYNPDRVSLVAGSVQTIGSQVAGGAFEGARLPLVATFTFNGQDVTVINNHFSSKGGSSPLFGANQSATDLQEDPAINGSLDQRQAQAAAVKGYVDSILANNAGANVVVVGDLNEFEFISPLNILEQSLTNLTETLPENERYSYIFEGNSQSLDHILISSNLFNQLNGFDIVHANSEFVTQVSDHDPLLARFLFNSAPTALALSPTTIDENVPANTVIGSFTTTDPDPGNTFTYSLVSGEGSNDNSAFLINGSQLQINLSPDFETQSTYSIRVRTTDQGGLSLDKVLTIAINDVNEIFGDARNNTIQGTVGADTIYGRAGNDTIFGNGGNDMIFGEEGNDQLYGGPGNDYLAGGAGNDKIYAYGGNNTIYGGAGNDRIEAGYGINFIDGGAGNDTIILGGCHATIALARGNGIDTIYNYSAGSTRFNLTGGLISSDLTITEDGNNTLIRAGSEKLATLIGVQVNSLNFV